MTTNTRHYEVAQEIRIDGITVLHGNGSLGVIYNNLAGLNITDGAEHDQYLRYMSELLNLEHLDGTNSMSFLSNLAEVACCRIRDPNAQRVTQKLELEALKSQFVELLVEDENLERAHAQGQDHPRDATRREEIDRILAASPYCAHPDHGVALKSEIEPEPA